MADPQRKTATSDPFMIELPSGTKLYGITTTRYIKDGNAVKPEFDDGSILEYYIEIPKSEFGKNLEAEIQYAAPGTGSPKYYRHVGVYNRLGDGTWETRFDDTAGAELKKEYEKFNNGKPSLMNTVVATMPKTVAKQANVPLSGLGQKLFKPQSPTAQLGSNTNNNTNLKGFDLSKNLKAKKGTREKFPKNLRYPENMSSQQDKLKIDMLKFSPREFELKTLTFGERKDIESIIGSVVLAIPGGIADDNRVNWGSADMDAGEAAIAMSALKIITAPEGGDAIGALGKSIQDLVTDSNVSKELQTGFAAFFADQAAGVKGILARTAGAVLNPNTELLFQGPALRAFTFNFKLSPRSEKEAVMVRSIIRFFKQGMAVQRTESELFLKAPHIFKLTFLKGEKETHTFLPQFKLCALLNCSVNYTPEGNYTTFKDSSMVSYEMSLTFNELDPIFNDDYGNAENAPDTKLGF